MVCSITTLFPALLGQLSGGGQLQAGRITEISQHVSWALPPIAVLIAIAFYLAFSMSAIGTVGLRRQLAHRLKAERRLRLLSSAVEQSSEGMVLSDLDGNILFVNHAFASMHDYGPAELSGKNLSILHTADQMASVEEASRKVKEYGIFVGEVWHIMRDGTPFPAFMHNSLLRSDDGRPMGMIATLRDITEQKRAEEALHNSEEELKAYSERLEQMVEERTKELDHVRADLFTSAKLAAMGRMGAGIAHQLNSPLCGGLLMIDSLMEDAAGDEERARKLTTLRRSLEAMHDVVECMLSLAMVSRRGQPIKQYADVNEMLHRILGLVGLEIQKRSIEVGTEFMQPTFSLEARVGELEQVFLNIINNAIDAMPEGGRLSIKTAVGDGSLSVEVSDSGGGIAPEHLARVFEPFFTTSDGKKGLGLGLSIAHDIVDGYGGRIEVRSEPGEGTSVEVTIPLEARWSDRHGTG